MAYTSILPVHRLDRSITYIRDETKTRRPAEQAGSLEEALDYAMNPEKTEQAIYEDSIGCTCASAFADMLATKKRFHKLDGVQGYHLIQSFAKGEVTPELAHRIGMELAEALLKGRFEAVVTTHLNTEHYHNHMVFNSVSIEDGRKYHSSAKSYYGEIQRLSDGLCRKYGLSVIQGEAGKGKHYAQWQAERDGRPTWRTAVRLDIREAVQESFTWKQFLAQMEQRGYVWKTDRQYPTLKAPGMERFIRLKSLGEPYTEEAIRNWILRPKPERGRPADPGKRSGNRKPGEPKRKLTGLQALYYSYLYQMGVLKKRPPRIPFQVREDIRRLDARIGQLHFLQEYEITTREQLAELRASNRAQVEELMGERKGLYRKQPDSPRIQEIKEQVKKRRKEIRMAEQIEAHSLEMEERLRQADRQGQEKPMRKEEMENGRNQSGRVDQSGRTG